ncbi:MAG: hypothetical protein Q9215_000421 [Flavoplaca cf. flavocitrina]
MTTAARTARSGLYTGLIFGLLQDATALARGRRLSYVEFLKGKVGVAHIFSIQDHMRHEE